MEGRNAARLFPSRSSPSAAGVARSGSRLFSSFSPRKLYDESTVGRSVARMMKKNENAFRRTAISEAGISPFFSQSQTTRGRPTESTNGSPISE